MAENADQILHFREYFKVIRNRLWVIFTIFSLTVLSGWYVTEQVLTKKYTASAQIELLPDRVSTVQGIGNGPTDKGFDSTKFQAEFEIMQSPDVLLPIINDLGLDKEWARRVYKSKMEKLPPLDALAYMGGVLKLDYKRGTDIIVISAKSEVPKEAANIANALADRYKTMREVEMNERNNRGVVSLQDQIAQQQKVVDESKAAVEALRKTLGDHGLDMSSISGQGDKLESDLDARKRDLLAAKQDYDHRRVLQDSVINLPDDEFITTLTGLGREEGDVASLRSEAFRMESDKDNLLKDGFDENHPRVQSLEAELARKQKQIAELIGGIRRAMKVDTDMSKSNVDLLQKEVDSLTLKVRENATSGLVPFQEAKREADQQQGLLDTLTVRLKQVLSESQLQESPVRIISHADPPEYPSEPDKRLIMTVSVLAGFFVAIVVAFLIEYLDTSVKTMADAELLLGLPVLTVIPNKGGPMPLVHDSGRLPHAEGYRILRAKLDLKVQNGIGPALSMLSGGPGEGKSTTIYNLAVVCAQAGQSVILVDCDLRRPTLHDLLGVSNELGLSNYLRGEGDAIEFIQQTALSKLQVLTAGNMPMSEIGVLAGDKIRHMLDDLKQRYDLVLIDSPPVLGISDGSIIAREVDYVILVIQHRRYPREISLRAKRAIEEVHGNCVGMVLNCVAVKSDDSYYYYSSYGDYYKKADRPKKRRADAKAKTVGAVKANGKNGKHGGTSSRKTDLDSDEF